MTRRCEDCTNALLGTRGVFCEAFDEYIANERVAEHCGLWHRQRTGPIHIINPEALRR